MTAISQVISAISMPDVVASDKTLFANTQLPAVASLAQDLTLQQLQSLHLGAQQGVGVPTLRVFMEAFKHFDVARPLVVEVKMLKTDGGRSRLLELLR